MELDEIKKKLKYLIESQQSTEVEQLVREVEQKRKKVFE